jgi:hypothetical protein
MDLVKKKTGGVFYNGDSTATLSRGLLSPPNDSIKHE